MSISRSKQNRHPLHYFLHHFLHFLALSQFTLIFLELGYQMLLVTTFAPEEVRNVSMPNWPCAKIEPFNVWSSSQPQPDSSRRTSLLMTLSTATHWEQNFRIHVNMQVHFLIQMLISINPEGFYLGTFRTDS